MIRVRAEAGRSIKSVMERRKKQNNSSYLDRFEYSGTTPKVVVLGASDKPERTSFRVLKLLLEKGYEVIPIHPRLKEIEGVSVTRTLDDIQKPVDVLTVYVSPENTKNILDSIIDLKPKAVILNPGTESAKLEMSLESACIPYYKACTIMMLKSGEFEKFFAPENEQ